MKRYVIGVDLGGSSIKAGLVDENGRVDRKIIIPTCTAGGGGAILEGIARAVKHLFCPAVRAVGVGTPGAVDQASGKIAGGAENLPGWEGVPLVPELAGGFGVPVFASNDVTLNALGEAKFGAGRGRKNVFCFAVGTGIGGGAVIGGKVYRGASDAAAEAGHMTVKLNGRKCNCGSRGCLESYASATAVARAGRAACRRSPGSLILRFAGGRIRDVSAEDVFKAAVKKDGPAAEIVRETGFYLGAGIANAINLFNPEVVIIGGGLSRAGKILLDSVKEPAEKYSLAINYRNVEIVLSRLHFTAGMLGAAALCWEELEGR